VTPGTTPKEPTKPKETTQVGFDTTSTLLMIFMTIIMTFILVVLLINSLVYLLLCTRKRKNEGGRYLTLDERAHSVSNAQSYGQTGNIAVDKFFGGFEETSRRRGLDTPDSTLQLNEAEESYYSLRSPKPLVKHESQTDIIEKEM
jgi:hypothetical protein